MSSPESKENQWVRMGFRDNKVWVLADGDGRPIEKNGRVQITYKLDDTRVYTAAAKNIVPLDKLETKPREEKKSQAGKKIEKTKSANSKPANTSKTIIAYTDGASSGNPGPAGSGVVLMWGKHRKEISKYLGTSTNNIAELTAIKIVLETVKKPGYPVRIHTDSEYAIGVLVKGWKAKKNQELIKGIRSLLAKFSDVELIKVPGHQGVEENERADELARLAVSQKKDGP